MAAATLEKIMSRNFRPEPIYRDRVNGKVEHFIYHDNGRRAPVLRAWADDQVCRGRARYIDLEGELGSESIAPGLGDRRADTSPSPARLLRG
jgi:hypothetical protein